MSEKIERDKLKERFLNLIEIKEDFYKADLALLDRYQAYSSELLRLSLAGLGVVGFFLTNKLVTGSVVRVCLAVGVLLFGLSAGCALAHRFHSSDGIFYHLYSIRLSLIEKPDVNNIEKETNTMKSIYDRSQKYLRLACIFLGVAALAVALGVIATLL